MMTMAFDSVHAFLAMGHYGAFVWSAWLISVAGLGLLIGHSRHMRRQFYRRQMLRRRQQQARSPSVKTSSPKTPAFDQGCSRPDHGEPSS